MTIVSSDFERTPFNYSHGGVLSQRLARECLAQTLEGKGFENVKAVLVEDDMTRKRDPTVSREGEPAAFIGERVLHWCDSAVDSSRIAEAITRGASGYPTNAFLLARSSTDLGLVDRQDAPKSLAHEVVSSLVAIVVSAFDDESFLIWIDQ
jgi:hypothetical protein